MLLVTFNKQGDNIMCGITAIFNIHEGEASMRKQALIMSKRIRHRGPDWSGIYQGKSAILAHERLSIVDLCREDSLWKAKTADWFLR